MGPRWKVKFKEYLILNLQANWHTQKGARTVPRHCQKTEWVVLQLLEWSSHSLAYDITQAAKTNHTTSRGHHTHSLWWPTLLECAPLWIWTHLPPTYCWVSHWIFYNVKSRSWASLGPKTRQPVFCLDSSPGREELKDGRKRQWEKCAEESPS